jgi:hypothetical protein
MASWTSSEGGAELRLELERDRLLPGRLVPGRLMVAAHDNLEPRAVMVTLRGEEHWRYNVTTTDAEGHTHTETRTGREELPKVPVLLAGEPRLAAGTTTTFEFELPVPALGPASFDAEVAGVEWTVEAKLDIPGSPDVALVAPVRVLQPVALLRAGAVHVGEFALYGAADAGTDGVTGSIALDPVPLCAGGPFTGRLVLRPSEAMRLQEIRVELRVVAKATVSSGLEETVVPWSAVVAGPTELQGELAIDIAGTVEDRALPTIELPHGTGHAELHVILARAWARDPHLVRDVAICSTTEV